MLGLLGSVRTNPCNGSSRRDFLKVGALGVAGLTLPDLLRLRAQSQAAGATHRPKSVVWLWLGGGATHVETFDPKMDAPAEYRSVVGDVPTVVPGLRIGGVWPQMARVADRMAFVRSFAHGNSGHAGGTHWLMTGYDHPPADNGAAPIRPSLGSIVSRVRGPNSQSGIPTYVRLGGIYGDGPHFLGAAYAPFDVSGQARTNLGLTIPTERLADRKSLLKSLDTLDRQLDRTGLLDGLDSFENQAFELVTSRAKETFDLTREDPRTQDRYGRHHLGQWMLLARRLCEAGCGFVTMHYGGWDMHSDIGPSMRAIAPPMDQAVSAFIDDLTQRGMLDDVLLVISGEFGRTPRVNPTAGRDHWAPLSTLAFAGGGLKLGQAYGESSRKIEVPKNQPVSPQDVMATILQVCGIDPRMQFKDPSGRPLYLVESGQPIEGLV
ncbi:MAG TPA: DUF1501 domain-containing protein [Gemmatales bacterium]|nr:DUF1501 domain-containing protein [Gemmatales bacterium]